jgi:hypothetical protein
MTNFFAFKFLLHDKVSNVRKEAEIRGWNTVVTFSEHTVASYKTVLRDPDHQMNLERQTIQSAV